MNNTTQQLVTLGIAVVGAALGVVNLWRALSSDRVKLRVRVAYAIGLSDERGITLDVVNLGSFAVTVTQIGFDLGGTRDHIQLVMPIFVGEHRLPVRLEPRAGFTVVQPLAAFKNEQLAVLRNAYVKTACGVTCKGKGRVFAQLNNAAFAALT